MEVFDAIQRRASVRHYQERAVEPEVLTRVVEAGRLAPTARNLQGVRVVVVSDPDLRRRIAAVAGGQAHVASAPVLLILVADEPDYVMTCGHKKAVVDGVIAGSQMVLQATAEGLGTCWIARFDEPAVRRLLAVPDTHCVVQIITLGYPAREPRKLPRVPMAEFRHDNGW